MLALATLGFAQSNTKPDTHRPGTNRDAGSRARAGKRPPQAKTQPEFDAYKLRPQTDAAPPEKAADDFAAKFPDSELRVMLYKSAMHGTRRRATPTRSWRWDGRGSRLIATIRNARTVASELAEKDSDTDLDKDQRLDEAMKMAQKSLPTVDTDISIPAGTPQEQVDAYKGQLRSFAYSIIGTLEFKKDNLRGRGRSAQVDRRVSRRNRIRWWSCGWRFRWIVKTSIRKRQGSQPRGGVNAREHERGKTGATRARPTERNWSAANATAPKPAACEQPKN